MFRVIAAAIASCAGAVESALVVSSPPATTEYVYAVDGVMCTVMQCMLDDSAVANSMCCVRAIHAEFPYPPPKPKPKPPPGAPPETLTSDDVKRGIGPIRGRISACRERSATDAVAKVRVIVTPDGAVDTAFVDPPSGDDGYDACLAAAFRRARFAKSETGVKFRYPVVR